MVATAKSRKRIKSDKMIRSQVMQLEAAWTVRDQCGPWITNPAVYCWCSRRQSVQLWCFPCRSHSRSLLYLSDIDKNGTSRALGGDCIYLKCNESGIQWPSLVLNRWPSRMRHSAQNHLIRFPTVALFKLVSILFNCKVAKLVWWSAKQIWLNMPNSRLLI